MNMPPTPAATTPARPTGAALLAVVSDLVRETHPGRAARVTLDCSLERDLGLDSLARTELALRIERAFGVRLADEALAGAETPEDLLRAVGDAAGTLVRPREAKDEVAFVPAGEEGRAMPAGIATLVEALDWHARHQPGRIHIVHLATDGEEEAITYGDLRQRAGSVAASLQALDVMPGEAVALMLPTGPDFFYSFFGILLAGAVPVPIYPPARISQLEDHLRRHAAILANAGTVVLVTTAEARLPAMLLKGQVPSLRQVALAAELATARGEPAPPAQVVPVGPEDIALLQYTSGSTGQPKGVALSHANLLANIRAMVEVAGTGPADVFVSWLPLYHDMGLICAWLASLCCGMRYVVMSPLAFLARPERWLWAIHRHRGTVSGAPNFAYEFCLRRVEPDALTGLDLSRWRIAFNGAEPVSADTMRRFAERFTAFGLRPEALAPVYGLAECAVGLAFSPGRGMVVDRIRRQPFVTRGLAVPADAQERDALAFVACGRPLPGHEVRVVDAAGAELPERREGRLEFRGPSATRGYHANPEATRRLFHDGWLDSGDYAYIADGEIHPTGRAKDIIIKAGRNIYPQELEEAIGNLPDIRKGNVAVFGSADPDSGSERLVVVAETRSRDAETLARLHDAIKNVTVDVLGMPADEVVVSPEHRVLKTSSGKVRRAASRELFERGGAAAPRAVWLQVLRLATAAALPQLRRALRAAAALAYGAYAGILLVLIGAPVWALASVLPQPARCWAVGRAGARLFLGLARIRLAVAGREHLAGNGPRVLVANHASYFDGLLLVAALPWSDIRFVAKRELLDGRISRPFLRALGCEFVDRFDFHQGMTDAGRLAGLVHAGHSPLFFPEGTFTRAPGLAEFRMGAFQIAAQEGVPVTPIAIAGSRAVLRGDYRLLRRGDVTITVLPPLPPTGADWAAAVHLRDAARAAILGHCGEHDLAPAAFAHHG